MGDVGSATFADTRNKGLFIFFHFVDESLDASAFVRACPEDHLGEDGREGESFGGEEVDEFAAVGGVLLGADNTVRFQSA